MPPLIRDRRVPHLHSIVNGQSSAKNFSQVNTHPLRKRSRESKESPTNTEAEPESMSEPDSPIAGSQRSSFKIPTFDHEKKPPDLKKRRKNKLEKAHSFSGSTQLDHPSISETIWSDEPIKSSHTRKYGSQAQSQFRSKAIVPLKTLGQAAAEVSINRSKPVKKPSQPSFIENPEPPAVKRPIKQQIGQSARQPKAFIHPGSDSEVLPKPSKSKHLETPAKEIVKSMPQFINPSITPEQRGISRIKSMSLPMGLSRGGDSSPLTEPEDWDPQVSKSTFRVPDIPKTDPSTLKSKFMIPDISSAGPAASKSRFMAPDIPTSGSSIVGSSTSTSKFKFPEIFEDTTRVEFKCPVCKEVLSVEARKMYEDENGALPDDMRVPFRLQSRIHWAHRKAAAIKTFAARGYPTPINWKRLHRRARKHDKMLAQVVISELQDCPYRRQYLDWFVPSGTSSMTTTQSSKSGSSGVVDLDVDSDEDVSLLYIPEKEVPVAKINTAPARGTMPLTIPDSLLHQMTPGYYGPKGARLFTELVSRLEHVQKALYQASRYCPKSDFGRTSDSYGTPPSSSASSSSSSSTQFSTQMQRVLAESRIGGTVGFVQAVLVPELAVHLVMEDMKIGLEEARKVVEASVEVGNLVHPDEGGEGDYIDGSRMSQEISVFGHS